MADPRSLHLQGIGTIERVCSDWQELIGLDAKNSGTVNFIGKVYDELITGNEITDAIMAMAIAKINSQVRKHGICLRINGDGEISGSVFLEENSVNMIAEYLESI